jgi:hypothetical protein
MPAEPSSFALFRRDPDMDPWIPAGNPDIDHWLQLHDAGPPLRLEGLETRRNMIFRVKGSRNRPKVEAL